VDAGKPRPKDEEEKIEQRTGLMIRNKNAMAGRIIAKILSYYQDNVLDKSQYYEKKFEIERILFLKIFNLYTSMAFITTHNKCMVISEKNKHQSKS